MLLEKLLVVDKEKSSRTMLRYLLEIEGFTVKESADIAGACDVLRQEKIDMILLDAGYEGEQIESFLKHIEKDDNDDFRSIVLLVPENVSLAKRAFCQQLPVSHQMIRPFSPRELIAMIRRCSNHPTPPEVRNSLTAEDFQFNEMATSVTIDEQEIRLARIEYDLLRFFLLYPNKIFSRNDLLHEIWGADREIEERTVDVHIRRLRRALKSCNVDKQIQTVHGAGYRFAKSLVAI